MCWQAATLARQLPTPVRFYTCLICRKRIRNKKMKKNILYIALSVMALSACKKAVIDHTASYKQLAPANEDLNADTWKPVLITNAASFNVAAPDATTSPAYVADIEEIKAAQASLTSDQKANIAYWSAGAVLRWNQILRDLVAKHNLAPYQN